MKKTFTLLLLVFTAMITLQAQTYLLNENFENGIPATWGNIDQDGDGFSWTTLTYDEDGIEAHGGNACVTSLSYDNDEEEPLTPNNYLVTPAITIPAGLTSANCIRLSWWVAAQDPDYPADYYEVVVSTTGNAVEDFVETPIFAETLSGNAWAQHTIDLTGYAGETIYIAFIHTDSEDEYMMKLDDISVLYFAEASIASSPAAIDFGTLAVNTTSAATQLSILSGLLEENITVSCGAPFEISLNNNSFSTTQTLTRNTNTALFVRYAPTAVGNDNGTITLTSGNTTATIQLSGSAISCDDVLQLPFYEDFESEVTPCWSNIDEDHDGNSWMWMNDGFGHESDGYYISYSYDEESWEDLMPFDWFITPKIHIPDNGANLTWWAAAYTEDWPDNTYDVMISETLDINGFVSIFSETVTTEEFGQRFVNITDFNGRDVYIAFVHHTNTNETEDSYALVIDDIAVEAGLGVDDEEVIAASRVYPNPTSGAVTIETANNGATTVEVYDVFGKRVLSENIFAGTADINLSSCADGTYFFRIIGSDSVETVKIIKR